MISYKNILLNEKHWKHRDEHVTNASCHSQKYLNTWPRNNFNLIFKPDGNDAPRVDRPDYVTLA